MFQEGDNVVLGVSGGADSICLLFVLLALQKLLDIRLYVVHVNHGVRVDAAEDAEYVEGLCRELGIPFHLVEIQLNDLAKQLGVSSEEAGRIARYRAFEEACTEWGCGKIAVAHNSNDRAETMLFHLFRGTGLKGMAGILPVRDRVVRPLLCLERREIEEYLKVRGIAFRLDSTNEADDYTRNRIRHHILPYAEENIASAAVGNMCRAADIFAEEVAYLEEQTYCAREKCVTAEEASRFVIDVSTFQKLHPVIRKRLLLQLLKELTPGHQDIGAVHIEDAIDLFDRQGNRAIHLPYGIHAERSYGNVQLQRSLQIGVKEQEQCNGNCPPENTCGWMQMIDLRNSNCAEYLLPNGAKMIFRILDNPLKTAENQGILEKNYTKWFDYDKINELLCIRTRKTGDYLTIRGNDTIYHKKLKDYMITEKIPRQEREHIPVLADGEHVLWLVGYRISERYKVTINTTRILQAEYIIGEKSR